jgi:uncharacterized protein YbbC (DUF1343 family)
VQLVALFSPEHGIRGELDQEGIKDSVDEKTGLPIYSLYGETRRPKPEQLKNLDALVFDIQDIGARFYTYISATLRNVMEEAAKAENRFSCSTGRIRSTALRRRLARRRRQTFLYRRAHDSRAHGLTIGELGMMLNAERKSMRTCASSKWKTGRARVVRRNLADVDQSFAEYAQP